MNKVEEITVIEVNKPSKEEARKKVEELSRFLSEYWTAKHNNNISDKIKNNQQEKGEVQYNNNKIIFNEVIKADKQSRSKALEYFKKVVEYTIDDSSIYAFAYMIINYSEIYKDNKDLLKSHISMIKERKDYKANRDIRKWFLRCLWA